MYVYCIACVCLSEFNGLQPTFAPLIRILSRYTKFLHTLIMCVPLSIHVSMSYVRMIVSSCHAHECMPLETWSQISVTQLSASVWPA